MKWNLATPSPGEIGKGEMCSSVQWDTQRFNPKATTIHMEDLKAET